MKKIIILVFLLVFNSKNYGQHAPHVPADAFVATAGIFNLHFMHENASGPTPSFSDPAIRNVVIQVFNDMSELIAPSTVGDPVHIAILSQNSAGFFATNPDGSNCYGAAFYIGANRANHSVYDNAIFSTIKSGTDVYKALPASLIPPFSYGRFHGSMRINLFPSNNTTGLCKPIWHLNPNTNTTTGYEKDLYSAVLSSLMHMLGVYSFSYQNGTSKKGIGNYTRYDNQLFTSSGTKLFTLNSNNQMVNNSGLTSLAVGCANPNSIVFNGTNLTNQAVFSPNTWYGDNLNLSHFGCSNFLNDPIFLRPTSNFTTNQNTDCGNGAIKRSPNQKEVFALCDLGYQTTNHYGRLSNGGGCYGTYTTCENVCIPTPRHSYAKQSFGIAYSMADIRIAIFNNPSVIVDRIELEDPSKGTLTYTGANNEGFIFMPAPNVTGLVYIKCYTKCTSTSTQVSSPGIIVLEYDAPNMVCNTSKPSNFVCNGDFESSIFQKNWSNLLTHDFTLENRADLIQTDGGNTSVLNWNSNNKLYTNQIANKYGLSSACQYPNTSVDVVSSIGGKQFMGILGGSIGKLDNPDQGNYLHHKNEVIQFNLKEPLEKGKCYKINYISKSPTNCVLMNGEPNPTAFTFSFSNSLPCNMGGLTNNYFGTSSCPYIVKQKIYPKSLNTNVWKSTSHIFTANDNHTSLVVSLNDINAASSWYAMIDNVEIEKVSCLVEENPCCNKLDSVEQEIEDHITKLKTKVRIKCGDTLKSNCYNFYNGVHFYFKCNAPCKSHVYYTITDPNGTIVNVGYEIGYPEIVNIAALMNGFYKYKAVFRCESEDGIFTDCDSCTFYVESTCKEQCCSANKPAADYSNKSVSNTPVVDGGIIYYNCDYVDLNYVYNCIPRLNCSLRVEHSLYYQNNTLPSYVYNTNQFKLTNTELNNKGRWYIKSYFYCGNDPVPCDSFLINILVDCYESNCCGDFHHILYKDNAGNIETFTKPEIDANKRTISKEIDCKTEPTFELFYFCNQSCNTAPRYETNILDPSGNIVYSYSSSLVGPIKFISNGRWKSKTYVYCDKSNIPCDSFEFIFDVINCASCCIGWDNITYINHTQNIKQSINCDEVIKINCGDELEFKYSYLCENPCLADYNTIIELDGKIIGSINGSGKFTVPSSLKGLLTFKIMTMCGAVTVCDYCLIFAEVNCESKDCPDECYWKLGGNINVNSTNNIIGTMSTTNPQDWRIFTGGTEKARVLANGNVGIGTTNPTDALHVFNNTGFGGITADGNLANQSRFALNSGGTQSSVIYRPANTRHFAIWANDASQNAMFINTSTANVGIGTSDPLNRTEINEITNSTATSNGIDNGASGLRFTNLTNNSPYFESEIFRPRGVLSVDDEGDVIWIRNNGNVSGGTINTCTTQGIIPGVSTLSGNLDCSQIYDDMLVAGSPNGGGVGIDYVGPFTFTGLGTPLVVWGATAPANYKLIVNGAIEATMVFATSDENAKQKIESIKNPNDIINGLEGKTYYWSDELMKSAKVGNSRQYGFLAQDVEKILPEAIAKRKDGKYGVQYNAFIPVLVESQKELIKENGALKAKVTDLESKLATYDEKFALLEKTMTMLCESGCEGLKKSEGGTSDVDVLYQSIPNPTDNEAMINYYLKQDYSDAKLSIATAEGKVLQTIVLENKKGNHGIKVSLGELASGTYFYTLTAGNRVIDTKRLQILKLQ